MFVDWCSSSAPTMESVGDTYPPYSEPPEDHTHQHACVCVNRFALLLLLLRRPPPPSIVVVVAILSFCSPLSVSRSRSPDDIF